MFFRRAMALTLLTALTGGSTPSFVNAQVQQAQGTFAGKASDARQPFNDLRVQVRDVMTNQVTNSTTLDQQARFTVGGVPVAGRYLVELFNTRDSRVLCTEGPYILNPQMTSKLDVDINCGLNPAWWLLAGTSAFLLPQSSSQ
jgi:hypothetical protein